MTESSGEKKGEAPKPTGEAQPAAPAPPKIGQFGEFLVENGIKPKPLPLSSGVETLELNGADLTNALKLLKASSETQLDFLVCVSGVDSPESFDSVYHLWSYYNTNELVIKVSIPKAQVPEGKLPEVPSVATFWNAANWHERETYDLVGIRYIGHPYLRRILNPWDWEGYPLRRDYKQPIDALNDKHPDSFR